MCINDWRAGRLITSQFNSFDISAVATTIRPNRQRVGIIISAAEALTGADIVPITIGGILVDALGAFNVSRIKWTLDSDGDVPTRQFVIGPGAGVALVGVIQLFMPESYLAAGVDQFISEYARSHNL